MKIPEIAPSLLDLTPLLPEAVKLPAFQGVMSQPTVKDRYRHWSKLKHLTPPPGLTHKQWWLGIKLARMAGRKRIELRDVSGVYFSFVIPDAAQALLHELSMGLGGQIQLPEKVLNPHTRDQYYISSLIEESITSSQLEGASTTRKVAEDMLRSGRKPRSRSEQMIDNNYRAMRQVGEWIDKPLTPARILALHRTIAAGTLEHEADEGRLRRADESVAVYDNVSNVVVHQPPAATELDARMAALCKFANAQPPDPFIHPIIRAIILHFWLAYDHPFVDGNGRVARALFYWSLRRSGLWLGEFLSISNILVKAPAAYARAFLYSETDEGDLTYFLMHQLGVLKQATTALHRYIARKVEQTRLVARNLTGMTAYNHRQRELLTHAIRHPSQEYTIRSHQASHGVAYETARTDLLHLAKAGLLLQSKRGHELMFLPAPDLESRLAKQPG